MDELAQIDARPRVDTSKSFSHFAPKKISGRGGFLTSLISELGGAGGAAGGAAIGTALLPGIGTIAGGALGALLGGTTGKGIEDKVRNDQNFFGKGGSAKSAFTEGGLDAALSGIGEGVGVAKNAFQAGKLADLGLTGDLAKPGVVENVGSSLKAGSGGYGIGAKVAGQEQLDAAGSRAIDQTLKDLKVPAGSPEARATTLGQRIQSLGAKLSGSYAKAAAPLTEDEANTIGSRILGEVSTSPGLTGPAHDYAVSEVKNLVENHASDTSSLWDYTKNLEKNGIKFGANADAKIPGQEVVNRIISDNVRSTLNSQIPGLAETNSLYSKAVKAQDYLLNAAKDSGKGSSLTGRLLNLSPLKGAESKAGAALEGAGKLIAGTGGPLSQVTNNLVRQLPGHILGAVISPQNTDQPDLQTAVSQNSTPSIGASADSSQPAISQENLIQGIQSDIQQTGGKNINTILSLYKALNDASGSTLTTAQQTQHDALQSALGALSSSSDTFVAGGGGKGAILGQESKIPLVGQYLNSTGAAYEKTKVDTATQLAKAITGSSRAPAAIIQQILTSLPDTTDTPQHAQDKLNNLYNSLAQQAQAHGFTDLLQQITGAQ